jgi:hypothetical protein
MKNIVIQVQDEIHAFLKESFPAGLLSECSREVLVKAAEAKSGKTAPTVKAISRGMASPFAAEAAKVGLTVEGFKRRAACASVNAPFVPRDNEKLGYKAPAKPAKAPEAPATAPAKPAPAKPAAAPKK